MNWTFKFEEESAGCFRAIARQETGKSIDIKGGDAVVARILIEAYDVEIMSGTIPGDAAYHITSAFLRSWPSVYYQKAMGCWTVGERGKYPRIDYDGRDLYLMVSETPGTYSWQGRIDCIAKGESSYFDKLAALSEKKPA